MKSSYFGMWFRVYDSSLHDPKIQNLSPNLFKFLFNIWCISSKNGGEISVDDLNFHMRMSKKKSEKLLKELVDLGMVDQIDDGIYSPHNWSERQYESDNSTPRVKALRERRKQEREGKRNGNVTLHETLQVTADETILNVTCNVIEAEAEAEEKKNTLSHSGKNLNVTVEKKRDYSPEFELAWKAYPQRAGSNDKRKAYQAWNARIKEGNSPQAIIEGIARYGLWCKTTGKIGTESVKQTSSFLGKADPFYFMLDWGTSPRRSPDGIFKSVDPNEPVDKDGYPRPTETCPVSSGWVLHDLEKTWGYRLEPLPGQAKGTWIDEPRRRKQVAI